jgi:hypothetical protein
MFLCLHSCYKQLHCEVFHNVIVLHSTITLQQTKIFNWFFLHDSSTFAVVIGSEQSDYSFKKEMMHGTKNIV